MFIFPEENKWDFRQFLFISIAMQLNRMQCKQSDFVS